MRFSPRFYRAAAACSALSVVTTLGLIFLPRLYQPVPDFEARMALGTHPAYVVRSWLYLLHPFLVFTAALAVVARCRARSAASASLGLAGFALWAVTEVSQQALTKVALDGRWRVAWPGADAAGRESIRSYVALYDVVWDAMYLVLLLGFLAGNVFLALAVRSDRHSTAAGGRLTTWVGVAFWAVAGLTMVNVLPELGGPRVTGTAWLYPLIQPASRALTGVWLWREADTDDSA